MAYTIQYFGGNIIIQDGNIDSTTSIVLPGRNYAGYGRYVNQDLVDMLQNFARSTSGPGKPIIGQLWYKAIEEVATTGPAPVSILKNKFLHVYTADPYTSDSRPVWKALAFEGGLINKLDAGGAAAPGTITGNWTLTAGSRLQATYADLAERFEADCEYDPGTVVELGGKKEITAVKDECSEEVFGVVSTTAAYLMNSAAGDDTTHPAIAIAGRVPVKVSGKIKKGDRLVSAGKGRARSAKKGEATPFNTIGRSLEDKTTDSDGFVLATVTAKM
jgi:hypothetical protein